LDKSFVGGASIPLLLNAGAAEIDAGTPAHAKPD
jgi:hypothetical protein